MAEPASEPKLVTASTGSGFCAVNCVALGIARLSFLICKWGLLPWSSECFRGVVPTTPGFKKKCRIPVLREGTVNRTSHSEAADPTRPLSWAPRAPGQGVTCIPGLESQLSHLTPSAVAVRWPKHPVRAGSGRCRQATGHRGERHAR